MYGRRTAGYRGGRRTAGGRAEGEGEGEERRLGGVVGRTRDAAGRLRGVPLYAAVGELTRLYRQEALRLGKAARIFAGAMADEHFLDSQADKDVGDVVQSIRGGTVGRTVLVFIATCCVVVQTGFF